LNLSFLLTLATARAPCHVERSETSLAIGYTGASRRNNLRFFASLRMTRSRKICGRHSECFRERAIAAIVWCFEAPLVFHQFSSCFARRTVRVPHRLDLERKLLPARGRFFFPSFRVAVA